MLRWAREWRGRTLEEAAAKIKKPPLRVAEWERGEAHPTVKQARTLAEFYGRSFLEFFLPEPPEVPVPNLIPDFRMHAGMSAPTDTRELREIQQWVETQRVNALDLYSELGETPQEIPASIFFTDHSDPSEAAEKAREVLGFSIREQFALKKSEAVQLPGIFRRKLEALGILTLKRSEIRDFGVRGICVAEFPLPVIVFLNEAPSAQAFTLAHEFAHILIRESGISGPRNPGFDSQPVEKWCDRFAAAFLMPAAQIDAMVGTRPAVPKPYIEQDELSMLAERFHVSTHAMLIRLVHLGYVQSSYYWDVMKPIFDSDERDYKSFGRPSYYGSRYKSALGDLYTGLVLDAWSSGRITNHNAAEYMGIKNISHLNDIRDNFSL